MFACSKSYRTSFGCTPWEKSRVAHGCPRSWKRVFSGNPSRSRSRTYDPRVRTHGRIGLPLRAGNIRLRSSRLRPGSSSLSGRDHQHAEGLDPVASSGLEQAPGLCDHEVVHPLPARSPGSDPAAGVRGSPWSATARCRTLQSVLVRTWSFSCKPVSTAFRIPSTPVVVRQRPVGDGWTLHVQIAVPE